MVAEAAKMISVPACAPATLRFLSGMEPTSPSSSAVDVLPRVAERLTEAFAGKVSRRDLQRDLDELARPLGLEVDLAWDREPDTGTLHYNAVVSAPGVGSFLLSFVGHDDRPWAVRGAQHRTDSLLLTVNGEPITVAQALRSLELLWRDPSLGRELVTQALLRYQAKVAPPVSEPEIDEYLERFRRSRQLYSGEQFSAWLAARGLSREDFRKEAIVQASLFALKLRQTSQASAYFEQHRTQFDVFVLSEWTFETAEAATVAKISLSGPVDFWKVAETAALDPARAQWLPSFRQCHRRELPPALSALLGGAKDPGAMLGPLPGEHGGVSLYRVLGCREASFDTATRRQVETLLYEEWLDGLRASAEVHWNWGLVPDAEGNLP
jgi:putative peptide maturation system protein